VILHFQRRCEDTILPARVVVRNRRGVALRCSPCANATATRDIESDDRRVARFLQAPTGNSGRR